MSRDAVPRPRLPAATYRVQLNRHFTFTDAARIVPYLHELGISDLYASPYFKAAKGSLHGYDIVDPTSLNPEVGTDQEYDALIRTLREHGMGQILDIVPNHMFVESRDNAWWMDVLENGPSSPYAAFFDINWEPDGKELKYKVVLPVLGDQYGNVLDCGELKLCFRDGAFFIEYYDHCFPLAPETYLQILTHRLDELRTAYLPCDPNLLELLSIIAALTHLPPYTEQAPEKIAERLSEKEIIKAQLQLLHGRSARIGAFIDENVRLFNGVKGEARSFDLLDRLLNLQVYRLSFWRVAADEINYRRFFDTNSLAAIRMEDPAVFEETHRLLFRLISQGSVTGLRVDHADGLYHPCAYLNMLQRWCYVHLRQDVIERPVAVPAARGHDPRLLSQEPPAAPPEAGEYDGLFAVNPSYRPFYIVCEKILLKGERLPEDWPVFGTTGYDFLNLLNGIFVETGNARAFDALYGAFTRSRPGFADVSCEMKRLVMRVALSGEINTLGYRLNNLSEKDRHTRDFTLRSLVHAVSEVIAFYPVYRSYVHGRLLKERDRPYIEAAIAKAKRHNPATSASIFDFLRDVLLLRFPDSFGEDDREEWLEFVMKFQQITGPVMAKGVEDTAFYLYNRLVSLNEVGGSPDNFGTTLEAFHDQNRERLKAFPHAMNATSTHDTKRSEDTRARINVLSEIPEPWRKSLFRWRQFNNGKRGMVNGRRVPSSNEEYLLYQTLLGAWPAAAMDEAGHAVFVERIKEYMLKALREAKVNSSWINPDLAYEDAVMAFVEAILDDTPDNLFLRDFTPLREKVSHYGMFNSLSQVLLKITSPGIPDFYQGTELWDFTLVDPDNRRPVDYGPRMAALGELGRREREFGRKALLRELMETRGDGRIKLYLTWKALRCRSDNRELFERGDYLPLEAQGSLADHVCAFARKVNGKSIIVAAPRFLTRVVPWPELPISEGAWGETSLVIPKAVAGEGLRQVLSSGEVVVREREGTVLLPLAEVFADAPVALLETPSLQGPSLQTHPPPVQY
jgi:(1->4)-alpha-D-glucan 1-alpha-D-glucosylmutase